MIGAVSGRNDIISQRGKTMISVNLFVPDSVEALRFYEQAFYAVSYQTNFEAAKGEKSAKFIIGDDRFALADENRIWGSTSPITLGGAPLCIQLFVEDVQAVITQALTVGAKLIDPSTEGQPIITLSDGTQFANLIDPFGFVWSISKEKLI